MLQRHYSRDIVQYAGPNALAPAQFPRVARLASLAESPATADELASSTGADPAIRQIAKDAGFTRFRRAAETPFNQVYEVRP